MCADQIKTPIAQLELLLEILNSAMLRNEIALVYDVFWALEANELYQAAKVELSASSSSRSSEAELLFKHKEILKKVAFADFSYMKI